MNFTKRTLVKLMCLIVSEALTFFYLFMRLVNYIYKKFKIRNEMRSKNVIHKNTVKNEMLTRYYELTFSLNSQTFRFLTKI